MMRHSRRYTCDQARERGYVTLFILGISVAVFLALAASMQASHWVQAGNRRHARAVQQRAAAISVTPVAGQDMRATEQPDQ